MTDSPMPDRNGSEMRVLVLEDEWLIALDLHAKLEEAGYAVVGPVRTVREAVDLVEQDRVDAAVLDLNLGREQSYPVGEALRARGLPFIFLSGYTNADLPPEFRHEDILCKPVSDGDLLDRVATLLSPAALSKG